MPGPPLIQDEILAISTAVESSFNTYPVLASAFTTFYVRSANLPNPDREKFDNDGFIGLQQEGPTIQRSGYVNSPAIEFGGDIDTGIFGVFARRATGAASPVPAGGNILLAGEVFRHPLALLGNRTAAGRQLPSSAFAFSIDELDYIYAGCVFNQITTQQQNADQPQYSASANGSGLYKKIDTIGGFGTLAPPAIPALDNVMMGAETEVEYTTSGGTKWLAQVNYASPHVLKSHSATVIANNLDTGDRRAGSKRLDSTTPAKGWVLSYLLHGKRSSTCQFRLEAQSGIDELAHALADTAVTDFTLRYYGQVIDDADESYRHTVEIVFPQGFFRNVARADDNGGLFLDVTLFPTSSGTTSDPDFVEGAIVNQTATALV